MSLARTGGALHHSCIHSGTTTTVKALLSSDAARCQESCSTMAEANEAPACMPRLLRAAASIHM